MTEKEEKIIKAGLHLFAKNGFASTTIQDIANECNISKGAFYLHFKSKEALLLAIIKYYIDRTMENMKIIQQKNFPPKETFKEQIAYQFSESKEHRDFILVMISEHSIPENSKIEEYFKNVSQKFHETYKNALSAAYGDIVKPYLSDLSVIVQGIVQSYQNLFIFNELDIDFYELADFIMRRIDDMIDGMVQNGEQPILAGRTYSYYRNAGNTADKHTILRELEDAKRQPALPEDILITLDVIEEELRKDSPRVPVLQGMLTNLEHQDNVQHLYGMITRFLHS
ncbi:MULTISPECIES: TetR/AcrR family transcriptional regulator [Bacillus]|uniref:TetR/AcrR family transcriptional regulator n=1 Tax=Bacillus TaxID=1386 RepID=UPI0005055EA1|nr:MULTISPECIES: TetR/AcrR family transcriptional regulator [Bacillus]KAA0834365.1 TetR/AcrR family transcriptional regulator [Bacillus paralicheniformis]KAA0837521.1 TetR/AcrR family transcriptional regulator [Bacillus paralicheniformis]KFM93278.1 bacterial regulatory s, tetR family protein [Bacillus paralicheniformis]MBR8662513.1 TetR/AcrR family transcriptional regulator [Bacillus paralicheniformis]MCU4666762.1 TetR/AcrR family transcriptional regulator [Bacillus paralicheniformis]